MTTPPPPPPGQGGLPPYGSEPGRSPSGQPYPSPGQSPYGQAPYGQNPYGAGGQPPMTPPPAPGGAPSGDNTPRVMSIASLVLGVIGLCSCMCFVASIAAVVLGVMGKGAAERTGDDNSRVMSLIGLALGVVGVLIGIGYWAWILISSASGYPSY